jgi:predicted phage baseplate assembly protein
MNTVEGRHVSTMRNEILGSSDGTPLQSFSFSQSPLLEGEIIEVREREPPSGDVFEELGEDPVRNASEAEGGGVWVRWKAVDSFFQSGPTSRHYTRDFQAGKIMFGDGRHGYIPQEARNNVVARRYQVGGGGRGNVNTNTLTALTRAIAYVEGVTNWMPAGGGSDAESVDEAKARAPFQIKSRDRAVTSEDFEQMAMRATTSIARAKCLPDPMHQGFVTVVLVPKLDERNQDLTKKLVPSSEILRFVKKYLDERRLVGTILSVVKPRYQEFSVKVTLLRRTIGTSDRLRRDIEERLRRFLHPLFGGRDAKGWPFGRPVLKSDLVHLVEEVPGVDAVDSLQIFDEDRRVAVEQVRIGPDELPHVVGVSIVEKVRDEII